MKKANIITVLLIIVGLVLAGAVVWFVAIGRTSAPQDQSLGVKATSSSGGFVPLKKGTDPISLETDLNNTNVDNLDGDLNSIGSDLSAI